MGEFGGNGSAKGSRVIAVLDREVIWEWLQQESTSVDWGSLHSVASIKPYSDSDTLSFKIFSMTKENL